MRGCWCSMAVAGLLLLLSETGCGEDTEVGATCHDDAWVEGVSCNRVLTVSGPGDLDAALADAVDGDCVDLAAGGYGGIALPPGVSLLGRGASCVTTGALSVASGSASVRGVTVRGAGIVLAPSDAARSIMNVEVLDGPDEGIRVVDGGVLTVADVRIAGMGRYGIYSTGSSLTVSRSRIESGGGPGLWAACATEPCVDPPTVELTDLELEGNGLVGVALDGVVAFVDGLRIADVKVFTNFENGSGMVVWNGAQLDMAGLDIRDCDSAALLVENASMRLAGATLMTSSGTWFRGTTTVVVVEDASVQDSQGMGVSISEADVTLLRTAIANTALRSLPVRTSDGTPSTADVGDGIAACNEPRVILEDVSLSGSARVSVLLNGPVRGDSVLRRVTLSGGDEVTGVVQQNAPAGSQGPQVVDSPAPAVSVEEIFAPACYPPIDPGI